MSLLESIKGPRDLDALSEAQLVDLCAEIRAFLVKSVAKTGGHLGPNLGVVETTVAIHRVFDSPKDSIIFDTGHQSYVHKLLTGRQDFSTLRQREGRATHSAVNLFTTSWRVRTPAPLCLGQMESQRPIS